MQTVKGKAGVGETINVVFRGRDGQEIKALELSKRLARIGKRTLYLVAMLSALHDVMQANGELPEIAQVVNAIHTLKYPAPPLIQ